MAIRTVIADIQGSIAAISGIREAPTDAPAEMNVFPFAVCYPGRSTISYGPGYLVRQELTDIVVELHVGRKDQARDIKTLLGYWESIPNAIMADPTLGGNVSTIGEIEVVWSNELAWGSTETVGIVWTIQDVKIQETIT